ncbi:lysylphosphatidylglycerol synthase transmembrane domain-containing protein [Kitasatospora sp. MBT63]|uniref:lysylphosphatidylglycerol synthase transmembrane domain-containing protein n=1 Tax=Kitasatospora sp. MBT63 TaxID=1444768 RepID=UPI00068A55E2|nr:lysylphosphatidylglycerol synthase transmembrane domain-containing protein [Kitasatospora sp. MBT63]
MATVIPDDHALTSAAGPPAQRGPRSGDPLRVRHPAALIRLPAGLAAIGLTLLVADYAERTAAGLDTDITIGAKLLPHTPVLVAGALCTAALLLVPTAFAVARLARGDRRRVTDGVLAAVIAFGLALALDLAAGGLDTLTHPAPGGTGRTDPVYGLLAPVLAFMTTVGTVGHARWRTALTVAVTSAGLSGLLTGYATPFSLLLGLLVGWTVAHGTRYAIGEPTSLPTERQLRTTLARAGARPDRVRDAGPGRYLVTQHDGRPELEVRLLDRQAQASGLLHRIWQLLRLRTAPPALGLRPLRATLERQALLAYAATAAGVRTPAPVAVAELGPDAAVVAYPRLAARPLAELAEQELTDEVLADAWQQLRLLRRRRLAHRTIGPHSLLVDADGAVHLVDLAEGEIAASELLLRLDLAGLLTVLALRVGPERAVHSATAALGPAAVCAALPVLQPIALARETRTALREHPGLVAEVRAEALRSLPQAPAEPVRLERLRPRTLITVLAGMLAGFLLLKELFRGTNPVTVLAGADPLWLAAAASVAMLSHLAAALGLIGFVPERLSFSRTLVAQIAGSFVKVVSPTAVGGAALNTRYLQRSGIPTAQALSSVGAAQLLGMVLHLLQLALFGWVVGRGPQSEMPSPVVMGMVAALLGLLVLAAMAVPSLRRRIQALLRPLRAEVLPRLLDLLQQPGKLAAGVAGQLLVSMAFVTCLYCCARAIGQVPGYSAVGFTLMTGNAVGSAVPTPGGVGGVETALQQLLASVGGMDDGTALAVVVLYRLLTFVLPMLPGWAAFAWLQRRKAL